MGIYLNPGNTAFQMAVNNTVYVDKSELIRFMNDRIGRRDRFICVSRPRRFGKSMAAEMLSAYYDKECDSAVLFQNLKIAGCSTYKEHLNRHNVLMINVQKFLRNAGTPGNLAAYMEKRILQEIRQVYPDIVSPEENSLSDALEAVFASGPKEERGFIFIVDEWDCIFRVARNDKGAQKNFLEFLRDLFKDRTYVKLAYMTGILPIKKYGSHSALSDFREFSMIDSGPLAEYTGFTEQEVQELCRRYHKNFEEVRHWYDGYRLNDKCHIYNPKSVVDGIQSRTLRSFWTNTETYEALQIYIDLDEDGLKQALMAMLGGSCFPVDTGSFQNDMTTFKSKDDVLTLMVHLGYLSYDEDSQSVFIPNEEVRLEFIRAVKNGKHKDLADLIAASDLLLQDTLEMNAGNVAKAIEKAHSAGTAPLWYNHEQALRSVVKFAYLSCIDQYQCIEELPSGTGYADLVFIPKKGSALPAMFIELKWNKSSESALTQIKKRNYPQILEKYGGEILLVGISYHIGTKKHTCVIEKYEKGGHI